MPTLSTPPSETAAELRWQVRPPAPPAQVERLVRELGVPPLLASMLWSRGFGEDAGDLLRPRLEPVDLPNLDAAARKLEEALRTRRRILIHGDYDADGVTGTAVLLLGLRSLGGEVQAFIPNRLTDGYGVSAARLEEHAAACDLFITVDCGISNVAEVRRLCELGRDVIVTDHHQPGEDLPECLIVHPLLAPAGKQYALTGAGVAYHLLWALHRRLGMEDPVEFADLAALGTVADVAPLLAENRALVQTGLERMGDSRWTGIRACVSLAGLRREPTARDLAFVLAPRLNAAGRLGEADKALEMLTTSSERKAKELAIYLEARNDERRKIQDGIFEEALAQADPSQPALVLANDTWHPGIMGIVAAKLLERFFKPVFIASQGKGSVRSTPGISAVGALRHAREHLLGFGGHEQAAGFSFDPARFAALRDSIFAFVGRHPTPVPALTVDAAVAVSDIDREFLSGLNELEPYGEGLSAPLLALGDRLEMARAVGRDNRTLQLRVAGLRGVAWGKGDLARSLVLGQSVNAAVSVREREWRGKREVEFVAEEVRQLTPLPLARENGSLLDIEPLPLRRGPARVGRPLSDPSEFEPGLDSYWLQELPLAPEPLDALSLLSELARSGATLHFDLGEAAQWRARDYLEDLATVADVRRAFVHLQRGAAIPYPPRKRKLVEAVLQELDLVDALGRVRRGEKRDPYSSPSLMRSLIERYRLSTLLSAYRNFDDEAFAYTATLLLTGN